KDAGISLGKNSSLSLSFTYTYPGGPLAIGQPGQSATEEKLSFAGLLAGHLSFKNSRLAAFSFSAKAYDSRNRNSQLKFSPLPPCRFQ
ncbi:hypothetical protein AVEN_30659-1, partial [Araneus ventricosus]